MVNGSNSSIRATLDVCGAASCITLSPNQQLMAVGGRDVLKVVALTSNGLEERRNFRVGKTNLNFSTNDIRWHPHLSNVFATAATNGAVVSWNLERDGVKYSQEKVFTEHRRAVNRICWHPTDGNMLLSGSQDGTVKIWDRRGKKSASMTYRPKNESIRDVRCSIFHTSVFALAFENGMVQTWDMRKPSQAVLSFTAHKGLVLALDWHPRKPFTLATGSRDRSIKIWNLSNVSHPVHTVQTIASVGRIQWRPNYSDQIASSASLMDSSVHVWDIQRPCIPIASLSKHKGIVSGFHWIDTLSNPPGKQNSAQTEGSSSGGGRHGLWQHIVACSKDGTINFHSLAQSYKRCESVRTSALSLNYFGQMAVSFDRIDRSLNTLGITPHVNEKFPLFTVEHTSSSLENVAAFSPAKTTAEHVSSQKRGVVVAQKQHVDSKSLTLPPVLRKNASVPTLSHEALQAGHRDPYYDTTSDKVSISKSTLKRIMPSAHVIVASLDCISVESSSSSNCLQELFGFDHKAFKYLACNYQMSGDSFENMCRRNSIVASTSSSSSDLIQVWKIVSLLYGRRQEQKLTTNSAAELLITSNSSSQRRKSSSSVRNSRGNSASLDPELSVGLEKESSISLLEQLDDVNPTAMQGFEAYDINSPPTEGSVFPKAEDSKPRLSVNSINSSGECSGFSSITSSSESLNSNNNVSASSAELVPASEFDLNVIEEIRDSAIVELIDYYTEAGDVQTCASVMMVLNSIVDIELVFGKKRILQLFMYYIDLLHQMKLYTEANILILKCPESSISQMNMNSTTVYVNCFQCSKPIERSGTSTGVCAKCHAIVNKCALCQQRVNGMFTWCPGCSHGGHVSCMTEWFKTNTSCPAGCLHQCSL